MKFVELHFYSDNRRIAVNPLLISLVTTSTEGITTIYYQNIQQRDNVKEDYETVLMKLNDSMETLK